MATVINVLDEVVNLLESNYTIQDSITPIFNKIYEVPRQKEPRPGQDIILVYTQNTNLEPVGIGEPKRARVLESVKIDIRSKPNNTSQSNLYNDSHARKVLTEVQNVLFNNIVNPSSNFQLIDPNIDIVDLSNGSKGIFRYVLTVNFIAHYRDKTA